MTSTTTFIKFTETRKKQIDHLRERVITERPTKSVYDHIYVTWHNPLSLIDYVVYAALRGADYRKGDHTGGKAATEALTTLVRRFKMWGSFGKFLPENSTPEEVAEFVEVLESELARWKDAPVN